MGLSRPVLLNLSGLSLRENFCDGKHILTYVCAELHYDITITTYFDSIMYAFMYG